MSARGSRIEPRRLAFHLLTALAVVTCIVAARWQWDRAHRTEADAVPDGPVVALAELDPTTTYSGMQVRVTGTFDGDHEVLVVPRTRDGRSGAWVLTPLIPDGASDGPGAAVAVVRGWIPEGARPVEAPAGAVEIVGVLVADARHPGATVEPGDPPTMGEVDTGALAELAGYPVRSGWLALEDLQPPAEGQPVALLVTELPGANVGLNWRNAAYAIQWVVFAGFAVFFWNRFRREYVDPPVEQETSR